MNVKVSMKPQLLSLAVVAFCALSLPAVAGPGLKWESDLSTALKRASKEKKMVLVDFNGSDWCHYCKKLKKEVFSKPEFARYAGKFVLVDLDFPRKKKQDAATKKTNAALAKKYKVSGFPTVLILDARGKVKARTGYQPGGAAKYVKHLAGLLK